MTRVLVSRMGMAAALLMAGLWLVLIASPTRAQGMLDGVPEKGLQKVTPGTPAAKPKAAPPPATAPVERDERLRMPEQPSASYDFLEGCWVSDRFKHSEQHSGGVSTYCFDKNGRGTLVFQDATTTCRVAATASYQGGLLRMSDSDGTCTTGIWYADHLDCERGSNGIAACRGRSHNPMGQEWKWMVTFKRTAAGEAKRAPRR